MTAARRPAALILGAVGVAVFALAFAAGGEDPKFMPKGGRTLLLESLGASSAQLKSVSAERRTEPQWREFADAQKKPMSEKERATLAAYLFVNMPVAAGAQGGPALPPDGRDLAWEQCQSCHSLFSGYLTQGRPAQGWRNMFMSPFHRGLKMTEREREEFARYSEINMPMKVEDVPAELRF